MISVNLPDFLLMKSFCLFIVVVIIFAGPTFVSAQQNKAGNVVIHSDPRLQLLKRNPAGDANAEGNTKHKEPELTLSAEKRKSSEKKHPATTISLESGLADNARHKPATADSVNKISVPKNQLGVKMGAAKGFRVQLYNGPDREKANNLKKEFSKRFPGIPVYMVFTAPSFRLKAGDFTNRNDAAALLKKVKTLSGISMIIPDNIVH